MGRILFLSQLFDPEPTLKGLHFVRELARHDIEAEVVTGFPNYPGGKIYPGFRKRWLERQAIDGIAVIRLATYMSHSSSTAKRIVCYASFLVTSLFYMLFMAKRSDLVYVYYPTLTAGLSAVCAKWVRRTPVVLDIQDMWPDSLGASGMMTNRYLLGIANFLCGVLYRNCNHILVQSPGFKRLLIERGVPPVRITVLYNWADEASPEGAEKAGDAACAGFVAGDGIRFLFAGNMGSAQGLSALVDAARLLQDAGANATLLLMGGGTEQPGLEAQATRLGLNNLRFLPRVPMSDVQGYLSGADVLIVHLKDEPLFRVTIPSKTQAYLRAGRPILMAAPGDAADLIDRAGAGVIAIPEDPRDLADKMLLLAGLTPDECAEMGARGLRFYRANLAMTLAIDKTAEVIKAHWRAGAKAE